MKSTDVSPEFGAKQADPLWTELLSAALIGPDKKKRWAVAKTLAGTGRVNIREFDSYPPKLDHLKRLLASFDVVFLDIDSDPAVAMELLESAKPGEAAKIIVYSERSDPKLAVRTMRAGAREYFTLPLDTGVVAEALARTANKRRGQAPAEESGGKLLVFAGSKGGSGVTTVACNIAIALAQNSAQRILLVDLALPIGDAALCLGIAAEHSTEDALRSVDRLDASLLQSFLVKHRSGVFVLAAPTKVPEVEVSREAIDKLMAIARREFDHVVVDVGSRIDVAAKALLEEASTIYLVTQTGISDLRNSNRLISQFFTEGTKNLEIVINKAESRFLETVNEDVISKALGRPVRWKIPDDQDAARALHHSDAGLGETAISRVSLDMASSISGHSAQEGKNESGFGDSGRRDGPSRIPTLAGMTSMITWPAPNPIAYGEKLSSEQLNATASVPGTFAYTPGPGYVLPIGTHTLWVTFTPAEPEGSTPVQAAVSILVIKATPALSWPTPAEIACGTPLGAAQLNAISPVAGTFDYSPGPGELLQPGTHTLSAIFTPADETKYNPAAASVELSVARAVPVIQWHTPDTITYGTQLSEAQLCATTSVPGSFEYNPGLGAVLASGVHKLSVAFTPADDTSYASSQASVSLKVGKASPTIEWPMPDPITYGAALGAAQLNATATIPGTFNYRPAAGEKLPPGVHKLSVTFAPADGLNYTSERASVSVTVTEKLPTHINWPAPAAIAYGTALSATQLNATASAPGMFFYTPSAGHVLAPGKYTLSASFTPSDTEKYAAAKAAVELVVEGSVETASAPVAPAAPADMPSSWSDLSEDSIPEDSSSYADAPSVADESADIASLSTAGSEEPTTWTYLTANAALGGSARAETTDERTANKTNQRPTRVYKGAVYEKGEDGQWHLQKK